MEFSLDRSQESEQMPQAMDSSSLRPAFMVSAPGKVIVYGEHAVVYGKAAIAAAISLRSYLRVTFLPKSNRIISLCSPDIDLDYTWNIDGLPWDTVVHNRWGQDCEFITTLDLNLVEDLQPHIKAISPNLPDRTRKIHQSAAFAFLYLFLLLGSQRGSDPCVYAVRSTIPVGAGLGSSASLAVCISTALLLQAGALKKPPRSNQPTRETETQINLINKWAFVAEMCIHGNPSGVDNTVSSGGKAVLYQKKDPLHPPVVIPLQRFPELPLLLVNTREPRNASKEIAKVRNLRDKYPLIVDRVLNAIGSTAESAYGLISAHDFDPKHVLAQQDLGDLLAINHALLASLGVSHPKLERVRELVEQLDIGWMKLTGAGGGGCAIVLPQPGVEIHNHHQSNKRGPGVSAATSAVTDELLETSKKLPRASSVQKVADLHRMLAEEGMEAFTTTLAGDGVGMLWPAVLRDVSSGESSIETGHDRFMRLEGNDAIESLIGMYMTLSNGEAMVGCTDGWRFWKR